MGQGYRNKMQLNQGTVEQERRQLNRDLQKEKRKKSEFDAQCKLDKMRKKRLRSEMGVLYLQEEDGRREKMAQEFQMEDNRA